jgi:dTDP-4-dehydrorhamnose reductase
MGIGERLGILVTGVNGQLGHDVVDRLTNLKIPCKGVDLEDFDLTDEKQTDGFIRAYGPEAVIHCAAYTAVDKAEEQKELCYAVNVVGTRHIATACAAIGAKMMYIGTDYVFGGEGSEPFETDAPRRPQSHYGLTKSLGEDEVTKRVNRHFIVRTSWAFGLNGSNFVKTMLRLGKECDEINVVQDQIGSPTYTFDLARLLCDMIVTEKYGTYHATNEGFCSRYDFTLEIMRLAGYKTNVKPIATDLYPAIAKRPLNSRMSKKSLTDAGFELLPGWEDALGRFLSEVGL